MTDPKLSATAVAVSLALLTTGEHAMAQSRSEMESRIEAGALQSHREGTLPINALAVTPGVRYANDRFTISGRGSALLSGTSWQLGNSAAAFEAYTPLLYRVRAEVSANASRTFFDPASQNDQLGAEGRLHFMSDRGGIWLGSGVSRPLRVAVVQNVNVSSGGMWTKFGPATLRGMVTTFFFTKALSPDSTPVESAASCAAPAVSELTAAARPGMFSATATGGCRQQSRLTDLEASVRWEHRLVELTVRGGHRFGDSYDVTPESREWASGQAAIWLTNKLAAVAGGGREPAQPTRGLPARSYASLGMMLAYWPIPRGVVPVETPASMVKMFEFRNAGESLQRFTARIGGVETVEIMGDFTGWEPVPLIRRGRDQWELLLPMAPGIHQINLRIDGGQWIAPPGMPTLRDGFNGEVGVLVIKH
jgi:AMP-activated protein kinase-like protein